jgi:hypothetical protein
MSFGKLLMAGWIVGSGLAGWAYADDAATTQPALVTLHLDSVTPQAAIAEFTKQTGVPVRFWPENLFALRYGNHGVASNISVNVTNQPLWVALDAICGESNLQPNFGTDNDITLQFRGDQFAPFSKRPNSVGPNGTIVVETIQRDNTLSYRSDVPKEFHSCQISLYAYIDPRARVVDHRSITIDTAVDENGKSIAAPAEKNQPSTIYGASLPWKLDNLWVPLVYDPQASHKLVDFKGSIPADAVSELTKLEISDLQNAHDTEQKIAGMIVSIHDIRMEDNSISVKITLTRNEMDEDTWKEIPSAIVAAVKVMAAEGTTLRTNADGGGGGAKLEYEFSARGSSPDQKPAKMVIEIPTKLKQIDLPFEFHDLQLP